MRRAKPGELTKRAVPVLAAEISETELSNLIPVEFQDISDPDATAEPSKGALIQLAAGPLAVLFYGKESGRLTLELPLSGNTGAELRSFLKEVPIPPSRIVWRRPDLESRVSKQPSHRPTSTKVAAAKTTERSPSARASKKR